MTKYNGRLVRDIALIFVSVLASIYLVLSIIVMLIGDIPPKENYDVPVVFIVFSVLYGIILLFVIKFTVSRISSIRERSTERSINEFVTSEIGSYLHEALLVMDSTAPTYNDEEEANRELISCLRMKGMEAKYQHTLPNGRTVDAKVGNILIEGKLAPVTSEIDRLLGQLSDYTKYGKVNIVIYGELSSTAKSRIQHEIIDKYPNQAFLNYIENPKRKRIKNFDWY